MGGNITEAEAKGKMTECGMSSDEADATWGMVTTHFDADGNNAIDEAELESIIAHYERANERNEPDSKELTPTRHETGRTSSAAMVTVCPVQPTGLTQSCLRLNYLLKYIKYTFSSFEK